MVENKNSIPEYSGEDVRLHKRVNWMRLLIDCMLVAIILIVIWILLLQWDIGGIQGNLFPKSAKPYRLTEGSVTADTIADGAITLDKLDSSLATSLQNILSSINFGTTNVLTTPYTASNGVLLVGNNFTAVIANSTLSNTSSGLSINLNNSNTWGGAQTFNAPTITNSSLIANGPLTVNSCINPATNVFCQGGNSFASTAILGTNDPFALTFETNNTTQATIAVGGAATLQNSVNSTNALLVNDSTSNAVLAVDTTNQRVGVNTNAPTTDLHVVGSEVITGHSAIGPDATLGDGILVTPLPAPFGALQARRTQYIAEVISDISVAPAIPGAYAGQGVELLLDPTTDPGLLMFTGQYTTASVGNFNPENFATITGNISGVTHRGTGTIGLAAGSLVGNLNLNGGTITSSVDIAIGSTNNDPGGVIGSNIGALIYTPTNNGTIGNNTGMFIFDQALSLGTNVPLTASNITTTGAALNGFGGTTLLNQENSAALTLDLQSPYNPATRWQAGASLPSALRWMGYAQANGYLYVTGGNNGAAAVNTVYYAKLSNGGANWVATAPLPGARMAHRTFIQNGYIYAVGGNDGAVDRAEVFYARINSDGSVSPWRQTTGLPTPRSFAGGTQYNGYLYIVAGLNLGNTSTVFYALPNSDGTIASWNTSATPLPSAWARADAVIANGYLYYLNTGGVGVYYAPINPDGSNGAWATATNSPVFGTFYHSAFVNSGNLIRVGGDLLGVSQPTVSSAPLTANGDLGTWTENASNLPVARAGQALFNVNGTILLVGGEESGTVVADSYLTLTRKVGAAGAVDLTLLTGASYADYGAATSLSAGNTDILGLLSVLGDTSLRGRLSTLADVNFAGDVQLGQDINFDSDIAHIIKSGDSTAGAGSQLSILGADGAAGFVGGDISVQAGTGTAAFAASGGNLNLTGGTAFGFIDNAGNVNIDGGIAPLGFGGNVTIDGGVGAANGNVLLASNTGNVGVRNATPGFALHVGAAAVASGTTVARFENAGGTCDVTPNVVGAVTCTSDARVKKNIVELTDSLVKLGAIKVYSYNLKVEENTDPVHVGFLAQELETILPDLVRTDTNGMKSVSYAGLTPYLVQALKQQQQQITELQNQSKIPLSTSTSVDVLAELAGAKAITLSGNLVVNGRVEFSSENKGTVKIPAGSKKVTVEYVSQFASKPTVVASPADFVVGSYKSTGVTTSEFVLELSEAQPLEVEFSWHAY